MKKRLLCLLMAILLLCSLLPGAALAADYEVRYGYAAEALWADGLLQGGERSFALDKPLTRAEGITMVVRLLGREAEASAGTWQTPFTDVPDWAKPYVGCAYEHRITDGTGDTTFSPGAPMTAAQFITLVLRVLKYDDAAGDFLWNESAAKALDVGLIDAESCAEYASGGDVLRDNAVLICYTALNLSLKGTDSTLRSSITPPGRPEGSVPAYTDEAAYPYKDSSGYWHYRIRLNGTLLPLEHDALIPTSNNSDNEILYPLSEILDYFGVAYSWDRSDDDFSTVINGVKATRDHGDGTYMWFSCQTDGYGNCLAPRSIDGVFYAPNYVFEHTIGATLTKISKGQEDSRGYVDITTTGSFTWGPGSTEIAVMRWDGDCYTPDGDGSGGGSGGSGTCTTCGGTGKR